RFHRDGVRAREEPRCAHPAAGDAPQRRAPHCHPGGRRAGRRPCARHHPSRSQPANVILGTDGAGKVGDFGLAKLVGPDETSDGDTPTVTTPAALSTPGTVAGTAAYMSPEQAMGEPVDARSDIFSFGAMLYEMVTGTRAFAGTSTADTLSAVIRAQPQ